METVFMEGGPVSDGKATIVLGENRMRFFSRLQDFCFLKNA